MLTGTQRPGLQRSSTGSQPPTGLPPSAVLASQAVSRPPRMHYPTKEER